MTKLITALVLVAALVLFELTQILSMAHLNVEADRVQQIQLTHLKSGVTATITDAAQLDCIVKELNSERYERTSDDSEHQPGTFGMFELTVQYDDGSTEWWGVSLHNIVHDGTYYVVGADQTLDMRVFADILGVEVDVP